MTSFIRTVSGDVPADGLAACSAHEHIIIDSPHVADCFPDFRLDDVDAACVDGRAFADAGGGWVVDTMPGEAGRHAEKLRRFSEASGVHVVASTGLHLPQYYVASEPITRLNREGLADLFFREVTEKLPESDNSRAGVIKVAGSRDRLTDHQRDAFAAAGEVAAATGCPIITHTERGTAGMEQVEILTTAGASAGQIVLSHTDALPDVAYHRELLGTGVTLEYDQHFRTLRTLGTCPTLDLIEQLLPEFPEQIVVGMDMARRRYWQGHGKSPGLAWLVTELPRLLSERGVDSHGVDRILRLNPAEVFAFKEPSP
ncbi:MAG: hypothetical protein AAF561_00245 [Planctomycetota bacterium]